MHRYGKIFCFDECYAVHTFVQSSKDASDYDEYSLFFFYFLFFFVSIRLYRSVKIELKVSFSDPFSRWKVEYKYMDK